MIEPIFKVKSDVEGKNYGKFVVEPLTQGYGYTLGMALRRVLLSSLRGAAVTKVKIVGIRHQFSTLPGLKEDIVELILNIKKMCFSYDGEEPVKMKLRVKGKGIVKSGQIELPPQVTLSDKDVYLGELTKQTAKLEVDFWVESGYGYSPSEDRKATEIGVIPIDAIFTPVRRVNYRVESTRVGRMTDLDKLILEIWTDGSIEPFVAFEKSARILASYLKQIYSPKVEEEDIESKTDDEIPPEIGRLTLEELELPTRIANALRNGGIDTVKDLIETPRVDLMNIKNVGVKSLKLVNQELKKRGLELNSLEG